MLSMNEFVDLRMQQQIAHEIYRQQIMQRIPDPFPAAMMPMPMHGMAAAMAAHHMLMPPARPTLPGCEAKLENRDLWQQFHKIGSEMIITKTGRRMFPSMRVSLSGLEDDSSYCVLLEMVPIGDCRYKFSGSQWVPAGGAEPQSPQRMYLHPDSPATGAHWQAQALLFNKVKLTNNTLDSNGHIVLASMHKYQPRLHVIRTSDLTQLPWAPQQAFVFPETEFVAVTAYQNDRITKLKIDNNPFAKGFRETGQSRCKRKMNSSESSARSTGQNDSAEAENLSRADSLLMSTPSTTSSSDDDRISVCSLESPPQAKRMRHSDEAASYSSSSSSSCSGSISPRFDEMPFYHGQPHGHFSSAAPINLAAHPLPHPFMMPPGALLMEPPRLAYAGPQMVGTPFMGMRHQLQEPAADASAELERSPAKVSTPPSAASTPKTSTQAPAKRNNFSISAILAY